MNSNELGMMVIIAAADAIAMFADGAPPDKVLTVVERMLEYRRAWAAALEAEKARGPSRIVNTFEGGDMRAEVCTSHGGYRVDVYQRESESKWGLLSFVCSSSLGWCEEYAQCVVLGTVVPSGILDRKPKEATPCEP